ncbi:hypothetical protein LSH36_406g01042 [Paralvinella palmiformis]|uniref:Uncharacterized protein n=1 Tax=Paralvinella palmiformis TaxID=53620 RepID=A0AAD9JCM2_9ANNE|nr:hypothetical protein LSH36_406g01042 [Paralvinella palmiformis]
MSSIQRQDPKDDNLNDSWVELHFLQQQQQGTPPAGSAAMSRPLQPGTIERMLLEAQKQQQLTPPTADPALYKPVSHGTMEKLLLEAQREWSRNSSRIGSNESRVQENGDWMLDWSSRPEVIPPGYKQPVKRAPLSVRNTKMMRSGPFSLENLPLMLLTHACTFFLGAAVMFMYLKRYCGWSAFATMTVD